MISDDVLKKAFDLRLKNVDYEEIAIICNVDKTELEKTIYYKVRGRRYKKFNYPGLRIWLVMNNKSQKDLANELGVTEASVSEWFCGKTEIRMKYLRRIKEITGLTYDELLQEGGD